MPGSPVTDPRVVTLPVFICLTIRLSVSSLCNEAPADLSTCLNASFTGLTGTDATWDASTGRVSKIPTGVVIENGAYVGI